MKKILFIITTLFATVLTSCITTIQPLVTAKNAVEDDRILGNWTNESSTYNITPMLKSLMADKQIIPSKNNSLTIALAREDSIEFEKMYMVSFNKNGWNYTMAGGLTKINNQLYMDIFPFYADDERENVMGDPYQSTMDYMPGYTIAKVNIDAGKLTFRFLDGYFIQQQVLAGKIRIKHEYNELFGTFMITASTDEMHSFLSKYGNDERIFPKREIILTRKAK